MKKTKDYKNLVMLTTVIFIFVSLFFFPFIFLDSAKNSDKASATKPKQTNGKACEINILVSGSDIPIKLEEYVIGVVAGEMPANFHLEALKAQAIAARTYVLKSTNYGENPIEPTIAKQVFYDADTRQENWQQSFEQYEEKVREAVESTAGEVIYYNGELITAMFHSMSNGMTESAKNYSGTDLPYLQSVASSDFQYANNYEVVTSYSLKEWNNLLNVNWKMNEVKKIQLKRNSTGRVEKVIGNDKQWDGRDFRTIFDLRSTDFKVTVKENEILITTEGYGHGVGMSQHGADALAEKGTNAHEILKYYYKNTSIEKVNCKN